MRDNWLSNRIFKSYEDILITAATHGTNSSSNLGRSCPSAHGIGPRGHNQRELVYASPSSRAARYTSFSRRAATLPASSIRQVAKAPIGRTRTARPTRPSGGAPPPNATTGAGGRTGSPGSPHTPARRSSRRPWVARHTRPCRMHPGVTYWRSSPHRRLATPRENQAAGAAKSGEGIDTITSYGPAHVRVRAMKPISYARHQFPPDPA